MKGIIRYPFQKFQPDSLHSWGILAIETASRTELHSLYPNPTSGQGTAMPVPVKDDKIGESIALSGKHLWDCDPATSVWVLPPAGCHCQVEQPWVKHVPGDLSPPSYPVLLAPSLLYRNPASS